MDAGVHGIHEDAGCRCDAGKAGASLPGVLAMLAFVAARRRRAR